MLNTVNTKPEGLLDRLQKLTGAEYLSDLRYMDYERIRTYLPEVEMEKYSLSQWLDAVKYLTGTEKEVATAQEVYDYLLYFKK